MVTGINRSRPYVNIALAAVNVLVFLYLEAIGSTEDGVFMVKHGAVFAPFVILGGEYYIHPRRGMKKCALSIFYRLYQLILHRKIKNHVD